MSDEHHFINAEASRDLEANRTPAESEQTLTDGDQTSEGPAGSKLEVGLAALEREDSATDLIDRADAALLPGGG